MEIRGRRFGSLERVTQSNEFGWVGLGSLTDQRKSVGTEDGGGSATTTLERDADADRLLGRGNAWRMPEGLCGFDKTMARG